jgi:hypothetical protein
MPHAIDARLGARLRNGDPGAIRAVFRAFGRRVPTTAPAMLAEAGRCDESTRQRYSKNWRAASNIDFDRNLGPGLITIAERLSSAIDRGETYRSIRPLNTVPADSPALAARQALARTSPLSTRSAAPPHCFPTTSAEASAVSEAHVAQVAGRLGSRWGRSSLGPSTRTAPGFRAATFAQGKCSCRRGRDAGSRARVDEPSVAVSRIAS